MVTQAERRTGVPQARVQRRGESLPAPKDTNAEWPVRGGPGGSGEEQRTMQEQPENAALTRSGEGMFRGPAQQAAGRLGRGRLESGPGSLTTPGQCRPLRQAAGAGGPWHRGLENSRESRDDPRKAARRPQGPREGHSAPRGLS